MMMTFFAGDEAAIYTDEGTRHGEGHIRDHWQAQRGLVMVKKMVRQVFLC